MEDEHNVSIHQGSILGDESMHESQHISSHHSLQNEKSSTFGGLCNIFRKTKEERTEDDTEAVISALRTIQFFLDQQREDLDFDEFLRYAYESMNHEHYHKDNAIFHHGERGNKFYLILKGKVDVYVSKTREEIAREIQQRDKTEKLVRQKKSKHSQSRVAGPELIKVAASTPSRLSIDGPTVNQSRRGSAYFANEKSLESHDGVVKVSKAHHKETPNNKAVKVLSNFPEHARDYLEYGIAKFQKVRSMYASDVFGEVALSSDQPRSATVVAASDLEVLTLSKAAYKKIFENLERSLKNKWKFFAELTENSSKETVLGFCYGFKERLYRYGQTIFFQDQVPKEIYVIKEGEVQIVKYEPQQDDGQEISKHFRKKKRVLVERKIVNIGAQNLIGEGEALNKQRYQYTAKCVTNDTIVYVLPLGDFEILREKYANIWNSVIAKHETKASYWKSRIYDISHVHEKIVEQNHQQQLNVKNINKRNQIAQDDIEQNACKVSDPEPAYYLGVEKIANTPLSGRRKSNLKLPIKIPSIVKDESTMNNDYSQRNNTKSSFSTDRQQSSFHQDSIDVDTPRHDLAEAKANSSLLRRRDSSSSVYGGKLIPDIVESKFKAFKKKGIQVKIDNNEESEKDDMSPYSLELHKKKKIVPAKKSPRLKKAPEQQSILKNTQILSAVANAKPYEVDLSRTKIKGLKLPYFQRKDDSPDFMLQDKLSTSPDSGPYLKAKMQTFEDTSHSKSTAYFKFTENETKSKELASVELNMKMTGPSLTQESTSPRSNLFIRLDPIYQRSPYFNTSEYTISDTRVDMASLELASPFSAKTERLAICINNMKTTDMVPGIANIFKKFESIVAPSSTTFREVQKIPTKYQENSLNIHLNKNKTITTSQHNMFRVKPNRLHILSHRYKGEVTLPSDKRSKK